MRDLAFRAPPSLDVAENATTPVPSIGNPMIWSTTASKLLVWNGSAWVALGSGGSFDGNLPTASSEPATPTTGVTIYSRELAPGNTVLKVMGQDGVDSPLQTAMAFNRLVKWQGGSSLLSVGGGALTASVTASGQAPSSGTAISHMAKSMFTSAATAGSVASVYAGNATLNAHMLRGNMAGEGGFRVVIRFAMASIAASGSRMFAGISDVTSAPIAVDPLINGTPGKVGIACNLASNANWSIVTNITGSTPTNTTLGANFPVNNTDLIELVLFCKPQGTSIGYRVRRFTTAGGLSTPAQETTGTISANMPAANTLLHPCMTTNNGAVATASGFYLMTYTVESDY